VTLYSCWFHNRWEQTCKFWSLIFRNFRLLKGLFQVFSIRSQLILSDSRLHSNESTAVINMGSHWFCIGGEQIPKPLNLILTGLKIRNGVFQIFPMRFQLIPNNSRWYRNESGIIHSWLPADFTLVEKRLPSCWISFWVFGSSRKAYLSCFTLGPTWFLIIRDSRPTNPPQLPVGFPVILHWGRTDSQAVNYHSQWIEAGERGFPGFSNQGPTDSEQFQMAQKWIHFYSHLGSQWFCIGREQSPKSLNFILSI